MIIYIRRGPLLKKAREGKERGKRTETSFHSQMKHRNVSYVQGANVEGHF